MSAASIWPSLPWCWNRTSRCAQARRAFYAGMHALADALTVYAPPEKPVTFDWPDSIRVDGGLIGGGRLAWPADAKEDEPPEWLVFGAMIRTVGDGARASRA